MAFWSDPSLDPKRQFKFKITFNYLNNTSAGTDSTFLAQTADRPVFTISDNTKIAYLDKEFSFPGKITWTPVKIKFVDTVGGGATNVSKRSYDYLAQAGWVAPPSAGPQVGAQQMKTISKTKAARTTRDVRIDVLDSDGRAVDQWTLKNAFVTTVALNGLDYKAEDVLTAEYTFRYDWAEFFSPEF